MQNFEISKFNPCSEALEFRAKFDTFKEAWEAGKRGDTILSLAKKVGVNIRLLTKAKALCANTVRHLMKDERSKKAIDVALLFAEGKATEEELKYAAHAAVCAAYYANPNSYVAAANAAAYYAANADSAYCAAYHAANADFNCEENQLQTAQICRDILTNEVFRLLGI